MSGSFDDCRRKIERAKQQLSDLVAVFEAFKKTKPYGVIAERDKDKRETIFRVRINAPIPDLFNLLTGECLQSLRSALDYAICALSPTIDDRTGFPIHRKASETDYKALRIRKVKGVPSGVENYIDGLKPYKGGNEPLWRLNELNNRDKHRLLLTAGLGLRHAIIDAAETIPPMFVIGLYRQMRQKQGLPFRVQDIPTYEPIKLRSVPGPNFRVFPLEDGTVFYRHTSESRGMAFPKSKDQFQFAFDIAFNEPGIVQGEPVVEVLHQLGSLVVKITDDLASFS